LKDFIELEIGVAKLMLLAEKAMYWPERKLLFIADIHFGKAAAYRALGQPVPAGTTLKNLQRLDVLLNKYPTTAIVFLGDFLHAPESHAVLTLNMIHQWRANHRETRCLLIRGNHDKRAGDPPEKLQIEVMNEPFITGAFAFQHTPIILENYHVVAGHSHPSFRLQGKGLQKINLACFHSTTGLTVLPSFGEFTGGYPIEVQADSRVFVTDGTGIWEPNMRKNYQ
jgi:uncharacterized protein